MAPAPPDVTVMLAGQVIEGGVVSTALITVADVLEVLLLRLGSGPVWLIVAVFVRIVPHATLEPTSKTNVKLND